MKYIALVAVLGILVLQFTDAIPASSVGGPMVIALLVLLVALAVGVHEAWTHRRGILGWILNIVVAVVAAILAASLAGMVMVFLLTPFAEGSSIAAAGGWVMSAALIGDTLAAIFGAWGALGLFRRWR